VIGGYVYRGQRIPGFDGIYLWGDFCRTKLHWLRQEDGVVVEQGVLDIEVQDLASFGEGADGELYVLSLASGLFRIDPKGS
jgi:hypothetical protein